jgi:putative ABC transport system substrate-binding protein
VVARAQLTERVRRIGFLLPATADDTEFQARVGAFMQELQRLGWSIGRNLRIDIRWEIAGSLFQLRFRPKAHESVGSTE